MSRKIKDIPISPLLKKNALKPCPFCGGERLYSGKCGFKFIDENEEHGQISVSLYGVRCRTCGCRTKTFESLREAEEVWNRRVTE